MANSNLPEGAKRLFKTLDRHNEWESLSPKDKLRRAKEFGKQKKRRNTQKTHDLKDAVLTHLRTRLFMGKHIKAWRQNNMGYKSGKTGRWTFSGRKGVPDIIGFLPPFGTMIGVEMKTHEKDKLTKDQIAFRDDLLQSGGIFIEAETFPQYYEEVERDLNSFENQLRQLLQ